MHNLLYSAFFFFNLNRENKNNDNIDRIFNSVRDLLKSNPNLNILAFNFYLLFFFFRYFILEKLINYFYLVTVKILIMEFNNFC